MKNKHLYHTRQREAIFAFLSKNKNKHITVFEIMKHLDQQNTSVGMTTIYRFLDLLVKQGKAKKFLSAEKESACYQLLDISEECHNHYHFVCSGCGGLFHIECSQLDDTFLHVLKGHAFKVDLEKTVFGGLCKVCS